jgi:uncharacterized membrane protein YhaH (DUF805 family)
MRFIQTLLVPFGRAPRWQFWFTLIIVAVLALPAVNIAFPLPGLGEVLEPLGRLFPFGGGIGLAALTVLIGLYLLVIAMANRLHDRGRTGFWVFFALIPLAMAVGLMWVNNNLTAVPFPLPPAAIDMIPMAQNVLFGLAGLLTLWLIIVSLLFPGSHGPNWFGRDPSGDEAA